MKPLYTVAPVTLLLAGVAMPLHAQQAATPAPATELASSDDIVVTALKRSQSLQDVPASVTALTADELAKSGITNSFDLQQRVPGLAISYGNRETNVAIRGVSNNVRSVGSDPSNAVHLDGIYLPQSSMILTDLFDIQRVEVLKGPQGTLYGRNATGGAINVISRAPQPGFSAEGLVGAGSLDLLRAQVAVNAGNDIVAGRIAATYTNDDGYTRNILTGQDLDAQDFFAVRGQLRFQVVEDLDVTLLAQVARDDGTQGYGISTDPQFKKFPDNYYGLVVPANLQRVDARHIRIDSPVGSRRDSEIYGATVNWTLGGIGIRSITGFTNYDAGDALDYDFTGQFNETFVSSTKSESFSQELQFFNKDPGKFEWTAGLFWYDDKASQSIDWFAFGPFAKADTRNKGHARAIFGQATYHFSDKWAIMAGARYNHERKNGSQDNLLAGTSSSVCAKFDSFTPQGQIQFRPAEGILAYAGVTKGFKSGGFNLLASGPPTLYRPEKIVAYEAGLKTKFADNRITFEISGFHYDYKDLQLRTLVFTGTGGGAFATINNAKGATINGVELNTAVNLGSGFTFDLAGVYLDAKFDDYISPSNNLDLSNTRLPLAPKWSGSTGLTFETELLKGELRLHGEYVYRSRIIFPLTIDAPQNSDGASGLVNVSARWTAPSKKFYLELLGRNIGDNLYRLQRADVFFSGVYDSFGAPRTVEGRVGFNF